MTFIIGGAIISGATSLAGTAASVVNQNSANAMNMQEAQKNRDWQERMSNTAYQRASADMTAAGINPILAHNPAGFGGGAQANIAAPELDTSSVGQNMDRIREGQLAKNLIDKQKQETKAIKTNTDLAESTIGKTEDERAAIRTSTAVNEKRLETETATAEMARLSAETAKASQPAALRNAEINKTFAWPDAIMSRIKDLIHGGNSAQQLYQNSRPEKPESTSETTEYYNKRGEVQGGTIKSKTTRKHK